jgi:hypothetical protein
MLRRHSAVCPYVPDGASSNTLRDEHNRITSRGALGRRITEWERARPVQESALDPKTNELLDFFHSVENESGQRM